MAGLRRTIQTHSADETLELGSELGSSLHGGEIVLLTGDLGVGKSVFARGIGHALGIDRWRGSPTFALIHEYASTPALIHADLYRLTEADLPELGLEEHANTTSILMIEWADRASGFLRELPSQRRVEVHFVHGPGDVRAVTVIDDSLPTARQGLC